MSYLALALVAGLASIERKGFLQAMISRPVILGGITGAVLGDVTTGLLVGAPLELLWLGSVNMGAALPVHETLGTVAAVGAVVLGVRATGGAAAPGVLSAGAVLAVATCVPIASLGKRADRLVERWNDRLCDLAERLLAEGDPSAAAWVNLRGLAWPFAVGAVLAPIGAAVGAVVVSEVLRRAAAAEGPLAVAWVVFCGFACASGARAFRSSRAPGAFVGGLLAGLAVTAAAALARGAR